MKRKNAFLCHAWALSVWAPGRDANKGPVLLSAGWAKSWTKKIKNNSAFCLELTFRYFEVL